MSLDSAPHPSSVLAHVAPRDRFAAGCCSASSSASGCSLEAPRKNIKDHLPTSLGALGAFRRHGLGATAKAANSLRPTPVTWAPNGTTTGRSSRRSASGFATPMAYLDVVGAERATPLEVHVEKKLGATRTRRRADHPGTDRARHYDLRGGGRHARRAATRAATTA